MARTIRLMNTFLSSLCSPCALFFDAAFCVLLGVLEVSGEAQSMSVLALDRSITIDGLLSPGSIAWSPDDQRLAVTNWNSGQLFIVDSAYGKRQFVIDTALHGHSYVTWSADGHYIAVHTFTDLIIFDAQTLVRIHHFSVSDAPIADLRMGEALEFSPDGNSVLFESANNSSSTLIYRYDLSIKQVHSVVLTPHPEREERNDQVGFHFYRRGVLLYAVGRVLRFKDSVQLTIAGHNSGGWTLPSSCVLSLFEGNAAVPQIQIFNFPALGHEDAEGSDEILDCYFLPESARLIVKRARPYDASRVGTNRLWQRPTYYEAISLSDMMNRIKIGDNENDDLVYGSIIAIPGTQLMVAEASYRSKISSRTETDFGFLAEFNASSGSMVAKTPIDFHYSELVMSSSGSYLAVRTDGPRIPVYSISRGKP